VSARLRLTLSYAGFLLFTGMAFVALLVSVIHFVPEGNLTGRGGFIPDRGDLLAVLWPRAVIGLLVLLGIGLVAGWLIAGRMLRPLHDIHRVATRVAAGSLDHRVRMHGTRDEFRELADTFDDMLDRLQATLDEQRRFAANASHELRTPYAVERAMLDVALADPASIDVPKLLHRLDHTNRRGTETVEALLALATLDQVQMPDSTPIDLAELTADTVAHLKTLADQVDVTVHADLGEGDLDGIEPLIRHLVSNLVLNGLRHNIGPGGQVHVATGTTPDGRAELLVSNTGPVVPSHLLGTLTEPFVRASGRTTTPAGTTAEAQSPPAGSGLGLAIAARVAQLHSADLQLSAPESGGLCVRVCFPPP
jgi:two-component system sensor histidine kinase VanS